MCCSRRRLPRNHSRCCGLSGRDRTCVFLLPKQAVYRWLTLRKSGGQCRIWTCAALAFGAPTRTRTEKNWFLRPARLPISPPGQRTCYRWSRTFEEQERSRNWPGSTGAISQHRVIGFAHTMRIEFGGHERNQTAVRASTGRSPIIERHDQN